MGDSINGGDQNDGLRPVPELPERLTAIWPVVLVGTGVWLVALVIALIVQLGSDGPPSTLLWTTVAGLAISFFGMGIMLWQRSAARRGARTAQRIR